MLIIYWRYSPVNRTGSSHGFSLVRTLGLHKSNKHKSRLNVQYLEDFQFSSDIWEAESCSMTFGNQIHKVSECVGSPPVRHSTSLSSLAGISDWTSSPSQEDDKESVLCVNSHTRRDLSAVGNLRVGQVPCCPNKIHRIPVHQDRLTNKRRPPLSR